MHRVRSAKLVLVLAASCSFAGVVVSPADAGYASPVPAVSVPGDPSWATFAAPPEETTEPESGIGPGTRLRITFPDGRAYGCTANFLWRDRSDEIYLGTAGHCLIPEGFTTTHGPAADYDASAVVVEAVDHGCVLAPGFRVDPAGVSCDSYLQLGSVAYAARGSVGTDFGIVRLPSTVMPLVRAEVPKWGGPHGVSSATAGAPVFHYGHGNPTGTFFASRARVGTAVLSNEGLVNVHNGFLAVGAIAGGDSGSPINVGVALDGGVGGRDAMGVVTHSLPGLIFGTPVDRAIDLARDAGFELEVVTVTDEF